MPCSPKCIDFLPSFAIVDLISQKLLAAGATFIVLYSFCGENIVFLPRSLAYPPPPPPNLGLNPNWGCSPPRFPDYLMTALFNDKHFLTTCHYMMTLDSLYYKSQFQW